MSAYVKGEDILDWADLWMRVDGPEMKMLAFDNMQNLRSREQWTGKPDASGESSQERQKQFDLSVGREFIAAQTISAPSAARTT